MHDVSNVQRYFECAPHCRHGTWYNDCGTDYKDREWTKYAYIGAMCVSACMRAYVCLYVCIRASLVYLASIKPSLSVSSTALCEKKQTIDSFAALVWHCCCVSEFIRWCQPMRLEHAANADSFGMNEVPVPICTELCLCSRFILLRSVIDVQVSRFGTDYYSKKCNVYIPTGIRR